MKNNNKTEVVRDYVYLDSDHELENECKSLYDVLCGQFNDFLKTCHNIDHDIKVFDIYHGPNAGFTKRSYYTFEWKGFKIVIFEDMTQNYKNTWFFNFKKLEGPIHATYDCRIKIEGYEISDYNCKLAIMKKASEFLKDIIAKKLEYVKSIIESVKKDVE